MCFRYDTGEGTSQRQFLSWYLDGVLFPVPSLVSVLRPCRSQGYLPRQSAM